MNLERRNLAFELRRSSEDGSEFSGLASSFYKIDDYGSMFDRGAFDDTLVFFLSRGFIGGLDHNWSQPIGKPLKATTDSVGLLVEARISDTTHGRDMRVLIKDGVISQLSIGFQTLGYEWLDTQADVESYWEKHGYTPDAEDLVRCRYGAVLKTRVKLFEVSPVTVPANTDCLITDVRSAASRDDSLSAVLDASETLLRRFQTGTLQPEQRQNLNRLRSEIDALLSPQSPTGTETDSRAVALRMARADLFAFEGAALGLGFKTV